VGRKSSVGIATRNGLDGPGIESWWGENFRTHPGRSWGPARLLFNGYRVSFPQVKRPGRDVDHPSPHSDKVKERVELYLWPVLLWNLPLPHRILTVDIDALSAGSVESLKYQAEVVRNSLLQKHLNSIARKFLGSQWLFD